MSDLSVIFIWHMHQPYYTDVVKRRSSMPWVRLHGIKAYLDMVSAVEEFGGSGVTMNLSPALIRQILEMTEEDIKDEFMLMSRKPASELTPLERAYIVRYFFMANWATMIMPRPEYARLLNKRGEKGPIDFDKVHRKFTDQEIRDLMVWFNLAWFGWRAIEAEPELGGLLKKGRGFTEEDKTFVLDKQMEFLSGVIPAYKRAWDAGLVEISASPMYHPILPLIYDTVLADAAHPGVKLPVRFRRPEDAAAQAGEGLDYIESVMGRRPSGMWPSEGSVAHEIVPLFLDQGVRWIGTDEGLLWKSVRADRRDEALFKPWAVKSDAGELAVFFRDRGLSDLIGFTYAKQPPAEAARDFVTKLREIRSSVSRLGRESAAVSIILDGENPWESYDNGGRDFLEALYAGIGDAEGIELTTPAAYLDRHPPDSSIERLPSGSWINNNFDIWIGAPEENKAWEYLGRVRDEFDSLAANAPEEKKRAALDSLYAAEGSDWFWWYGDDFTSELDSEFDYLFRLHLKNVYVLLGEESPEFLDEPVLFEHSVRTEEPVDFIQPVIDGKVTDYYEWRCAGRLDLKSQGAMYQGTRRLSQIYFGFDMNNFYLRLDPDSEGEGDGGVSVRLHVLAPEKRVIVFPFLNARTAELFLETPDESLIPYGSVVIEIMEGEVVMERYPRDGFISFTIPDDSFEGRHWSV